MSIVLYGKKIDVPNTACFLDPPEVVRAVTEGKGTVIPRSTEGYKRNPETDWIRGHITHTTSGTVNKLQPRSLLKSTMDWIYSLSNVRKDEVSWTLTKDTDESAIQVSDPGSLATWHANQVNQYVDGWELVQTSNGELTEQQLDGYVRLCDEWSYHCGIPRVIAWRNGGPYLGMISRALSAQGAGASLCLFYGHCNIWGCSPTGKLYSIRGPGDPSALPFKALKDAGYITLDVESGDDLRFWKEIQLRLRQDPDGIPGPRTRAAMIKDGSYGAGGMLVPRPGDDKRGVPAWLAARPMSWWQLNGLS